MAESASVVYRYATPSSVSSGSEGERAVLATSSPDLTRPWFFEGSVRQPELVAAMLLAVARVGRARFTLAPETIAAMRDPVATADVGVLRFEAFSQCNGVYARFDYPLGEWSSDLQHDVGTTNVDFNEAMIGALSRVGRERALVLSVGQEAVAVETDDGQVVERQVALSEQWVRGFGEAAVGLAATQPLLDADPATVRAFVRGLGSSPARQPLWLTARGRDLRLSTRTATGAVAVGGVERVKLLEPVLRFARSITIHGRAEPDSPTVWDVELLDDEGARFTLALSPGAYRGFSGEGNVLHALTDVDDETVQAVRDALCWQPALDPITLATGLGRPVGGVESGLAVLAASGLVGFDVHHRTWFHRELPYQLDDAVRLHPRLRSATRTLERDDVTRLSAADGTDEYLVRSTGGEHLVRLRGDDASCTCTWWFRYQGRRGPCQHVTAARLARTQPAADAAPPDNHG